MACLGTHMPSDNSRDSYPSCAVRPRQARISRRAARAGRSPDRHRLTSITLSPEPHRVVNILAIAKMREAPWAVTARENQIQSQRGQRLLNFRCIVGYEVASLLDMRVVYLLKGSDSR